MNRPYDQEERKSWITRLRSFIRFSSNLVGVDVLDDPRSNKFCFLNGYWYVATRKANAFSSRTVEDAGPYRQKFKSHQHADTERKPYRFRVVEDVDPYRQKIKPHRYADTERKPYRFRVVEDVDPYRQKIQTASIRRYTFFN
ncbi:MAG: hypothetical protein E7629_06840 [Ruminococcaceae bacterium]|nr:hypothetical protein [Oscillospiraceae bacterium]